MRWLNAAAGLLRVTAWLVLGGGAWMCVLIYQNPPPPERVVYVPLLLGLVVVGAGLLYWLGRWLGGLEAVRSQPLTRKEKRAFEVGLFAVWFVAAWWFGWLDAMVEGAKQGWEEGWNRP